MRHCISKGKYGLYMYFKAGINENLSSISFSNVYILTWSIQFIPREILNLGIEPTIMIYYVLLIN